MNDLKNFFFSVQNITWPDFKKLANWSYLSDNAVSVDSPFLPLLAIAFLAMIIIGLIASFILARRQNHLPIYGRLRGHIFNLTLWLGSIGIFLVLARYQGIQFFSSRLLFVANLLTIIIWGGWIIQYVLRRLPQEKADYLKKKKFQSFLPKAKKK